MMFPGQDYSSLNYLDIVVDAALTLTNSPENIGLPEKKPRTKVKLFPGFTTFCSTFGAPR